MIVDKIICLIVICTQWLMRQHTIADIYYIYYNTFLLSSISNVFKVF